MNAFRRIAAASCVAFSASTFMAHAICAPIEAPEPSPALETFKLLVFESQFEMAAKSWQITDNQKAQIAATLKRAYPDGISHCVTIKRHRPSPHWIAEVILYEHNGGIGYIVVSGETKGDKFRMINFWLTGDFAEIRALQF